MDVDKQPCRDTVRMVLKDPVWAESCPAPQVLTFPALGGRCYLFHFIEENVAGGELVLSLILASCYTVSVRD